MSADRMWAYCPKCKHTQRFERVQTNHWVHAVLTVCTLGLWLVSWVAVTIGHRLKPWHCKQCDGNEHGEIKKRLAEQSSKDTGAQPVG